MALRYTREDAEAKFNKIKDNISYEPGRKDNLPELQPIGQNDNMHSEINFVRGGAQVRLRAIAKNVKDFTKFLASPKGIVWTMKQQGLKLMNPKRDYVGGIDPIRIFNSAKLLSSYSGIPNTSHGQFNNDGMYSVYMPKQNQGDDWKKNNRIVQVYNELQLNKNVDRTITFNPFGLVETASDAVNNRLNKIKQKISNNSIGKVLFDTSNKPFKGKPINTLSGINGPNSWLGVGNTIIRKHTSGLPLTIEILNQYQHYSSESQYTDLIKETDSVIKQIYDSTYTDKLQPGYKSNGGNPVTVEMLNEYNLNTYQSIKKFTKDDSVKSISFNDYSTTPNEDIFESTYGALANPSDYYKERNMEKRLGVAGSSNNYRDSLYKSNFATSEDLIKVKFHEPDGSNQIQFRAYISGLTDSTTPNWTNVSYIGRPDDMFIYTGYSRSLSFTLTVVVNSFDEMNVIYNKLNRLVAYTTPDVSDNGNMIGKILSLKVGMWLAQSPSTGVPGILKSCNFTINDDYTWDLIKEKPMIIQIGITFDVIGSQTYTSKVKQIGA